MVAACGNGSGGGNEAGGDGTGGGGGGSIQEVLAYVEAHLEPSSLRTLTRNTNDVEGNDFLLWLEKAGREGYFSPGRTKKADFTEDTNSNVESGSGVGSNSRTNEDEFKNKRSRSND